MKKIAVVFGTRPEAIKMAPVVHAIRASTDLQAQIVVTGQHREMLDQVLQLFNLVPDVDMKIMRPGQTLSEITTRVLDGISGYLKESKPDLVLVHGDTTTALGAALGAFYERVPVGHVEAGLRTGDMQSPWPEEMNRRLISPLSEINFSPTRRAKDALLAEGISKESVHVTGNTVIDALRHTCDQLDANPTLQTELDDKFAYLRSGSRLVLVTGHRRENFGKGFDGICTALRRLSEDADIDVVYPVHLNPNVSGPVHKALKGLERVHLIEPLDYLPFVYLMRRSTIILTDSGGIQEEAPFLGKPVLLMRDTTERPEAVEAGTVRLVGTNEERIVQESVRLLDDSSSYETMAKASNPYGDGFAAERITKAIQQWAYRSA